jgi:alanine racemase
MYRKTFLEIDTGKLKENIQTLLTNYPDYQYHIGVVKGNAYGHSYDVVPTMLSAGINFFAVSSLEEGIEVRTRTENTPILCLQPLHLDELETCIEKNVSVTLSSFEYFQKIKDLKFEQSLKIHLKIDSGLNRLGLKVKTEIEEIVKTLKDNPNFELEGIYSHFATTGVFDTHWDLQRNNFEELTKDIDLNLFKIRHLGRSLTLLNHNKIPYCNAVRIGLLMYGYNQSPSKAKVSQVKKLKRLFSDFLKAKPSDTFTDHDLQFQPVLSLKSEVVEIKKVEAGDLVGYGASYQVERAGHIAIVPIGYADGFSKRNKGFEVLINHKRYKMVSEVNMGMLTVLVDNTVKVGDAVVLFGEGLPIQEVAKRTQTTIYEVMCALQTSLPRILK